MSDSERKTWEVSDQKVEQTVETGGGCRKGTHDKPYFKIPVFSFAAMTAVISSQGTLIFSPKTRY